MKALRDKLGNKKAITLAVIYLLLFQFLIFTWVRPMRNITFRYGDFEALDGIVYLDYLSGITEESGYYIDTSMGYEGEDVPVALKPMNLPAGSYKIRMHYSANDHANAFSTTSKWMNNSVINGYQCRGLEEGIDKEQVLSWFLPHSVQDVGINYRFSGTGYLYVESVELEETYLYKILATIFSLVIGTCCTAFAFRKRKLTKEERLTVFVLGGLVVFSSFPVFSTYLRAGHDILFHLNRIEAIAVSIQEGVFPHRIGGWLNGGASYPAPIFYGETFLYIPALLRVLGVSVKNAYKSYVVVVNIATVLVAFGSFRAFFKKKSTVLLSTILYVLAPYRLVCVYLRAAVGEYTAMIFYPLAAYALYRIYTAGSKEEHRKGRIVLALAFSGLLQCHILGTVIAAIATVLVILMMLRQTFRKEVILDFCIAGVGTALLSAWFLIPYITFDKSLINVFNYTCSITTGQHGIHPAQLFSFFPKGEGGSIYIWEEFPQCDEMPLGIGIGQMFVLVMYLLYRILGGRGTGTGRVSAAMTIMMIFVTTTLFPLELIGRIAPLCEAIVTNIQFPWRFLGIVCLSTAVLGGTLWESIDGHELERFRDIILIGMLAGTFLSAGYFEEQYIDRGINLTFVLTEDLDSSSVGGGEYMLAPKVARIVDEEGMQPILSDVVFKNGHYTANVQNPSADEKIISTPIYNYAGYVADDQNGNRLEIQGGLSRYVRVIIPPGYEGSIRVHYPERNLWKLADVISALSLLGLVVYPAALWLKKRKK